MAYQTTNPFDAKVTATFPEIDAAALEAKLARASTCYTEWRGTTFAYRAAVLSKAAAILRARPDEFASKRRLDVTITKTWPSWLLGSIVAATRRTLPSTSPAPTILILAD